MRIIERIAHLTESDSVEDGVKAVRPIPGGPSQRPAEIYVDADSRSWADIVKLHTSVKDATGAENVVVVGPISGRNKAQTETIEYFTRNGVRTTPLEYPEYWQDKRRKRNAANDASGPGTGGGGAVL